MRKLVFGVLLVASIWSVPGATAAVAAEPQLSGRYSMAVTRTVADRLDGRVGERFQRGLRIRKVASGRCAWQASVETFSGDFERFALCRTAPGRFRGSYVFRRQCPSGGGSSASTATFSFSRSSTARRDGKQYVTRMQGRFGARSSSDSCGVASREGWKMAVTRTDLPPARVAPLADFVVEPDEPYSVAAGTNRLFFTDASEDPDGGTITQRTWDFGDAASGSANRSSLDAPEHVYARPGSYRVTLTVRDDEGVSAKTSLVVTVAA